MIQSELPIRRIDDQHDERKRHLVVGIIGPGGDVQEEHQMHAHLRDREHDGRNGGSGMGLAIVQAVMTSHGGSICLPSEAGAAFMLRFLAG